MGCEAGSGQKAEGFENPLLCVLRVVLVSALVFLGSARASPPGAKKATICHNTIDKEHDSAYCESKIANERISISLRLELAADGSAVRSRRTFVRRGSKRRTTPCTLSAFHGLDGQLVWQSQRDCGPKPRVGALRLPWEGGGWFRQPQRGCARPPLAPRWAATPLGLLSHWTVTPGSAVGATLGLEAESRWDSGRELGRSELVRLV